MRFCWATLLTRAHNKIIIKKIEKRKPHRRRRRRRRTGRAFVWIELRWFHDSLWYFFLLYILFLFQSVWKAISVARCDMWRARARAVAFGLACALCSGRTFSSTISKSSMYVEFLNSGENVCCSCRSYQFCRLDGCHCGRIDWHQFNAVRIKLDARAHRPSAGAVDDAVECECACARVNDNNHCVRYEVQRGVWKFWRGSHLFTSRMTNDERTTRPKSKKK